MRFQSFSQLLQIDSDLSFGPPSSTFFRVGERSNRGPSTVAILLYREVENHYTFRSSYTLEKVPYFTGKKSGAFSLAYSC